METDKRKRRRKRRKKKKEKKIADSPEFTVSLTELQLIFHDSCHLLRPLPHRRSSSTPPPDWVRSACSSSFFFFFLIQLYCKNLIFFFVFGLFETYFESEAKLDRLVLPSSCVSFYFVFLCFFFKGSDSKGTVRNGLITVLRTVRLNRGSNGFLLFWH